MDRVYDERINWENEPSVNTPINENNLNKMDYAIFIIDGRVVEQSTTKANQSDLLQSIKSVEYETSTGIFTFTWWNGLVKTIDLAVEKIPVSFRMDENGIITMTNADGTSYTADVGAMIKYYTFENSDRIAFTMIPDGKNYKVEADIVKGSITGEYLQPNYLADVTAQAIQSTARATEAKSYAVGGTGTREGEDSDNAKYYMEQAKAIVNVDIATTEKAGIVKPDGTTITIESDGTIHAQGGASPSVEKSIAENWQGTGYNLIPFPYYRTSQIINSITWTVNSDGTITANGTAASTSIFRLSDPALDLPTLQNEKNYAVSALCDDEEGRIELYRPIGTSESITARGKQFVPFKYVNTGYNTSINLYISAGVTVSNVTFKPMLVEVAEDGSYPTEYQRYADGNVNLTDKVNNITESIEGIEGDIEDIQGDVDDLTEGLNGFSFATVDDKDGYYKDGEFHPFSKGTVKELLWVNPNPTSAFAAQTIALDLTEYEECIVEYNDSTSATSQIATRVLINKNDTYNMFGAGTTNASGASGRGRIMSMSDNGISFGNGASTTKDNNGVIIPLKIYGLKQGVPSSVQNKAYNVLTVYMNRVEILENNCYLYNTPDGSLVQHIECKLKVIKSANADRELVGGLGEINATLEFENYKMKHSSTLDGTYIYTKNAIVPGDIIECNTDYACYIK